ncbi:MAG: bifunctional phosphopantothenoylcysteine decarboxylase/phosphopantothenate--cysteine ligase CoaBC, partial [Solirubrobacteraceae bacterium]|nr:bifunctional phosphopantothenoylcysteine decarboxylase/phosphopantothenate--cysteine ligase CoaBC [Solirubrobacteraceae bacterium]
ARILLGVSGSIAAYKALELIRLLTGAGHGVRVLLTDGGAQFVGEASFAALTGAPVLSGVFDDDPWGGAYPGEDRSDAHRPIGHLALAERADLLVIAPASANVIARLAGGFADDMLTTAALVAEKVLIAPAMNGRMWEHPATRANLALLRERGVQVAEPGTGRLASKGESGTGRLAEPEELLARIDAELAVESERRHDLAGRRVLISAGGTREPLDAVRFIGNRSSGRMGFALAEAAAARGAYVTVVAANVALQTPAGVSRIDVETAAQLQAACAESFLYADVLIAAAAVADFRPATQAAGKMKKQPGEETRTMELEKTPDVLAGLAAARKDGQVVVGFAAEHGDGALAYGRDKLVRKGLDAIVVNDISDKAIGFDSADNEVVIVTADAETPVPRGTKRAIADAILDVVGPLRR